MRASWGTHVRPRAETSREKGEKAKRKRKWKGGDAPTSRDEYIKLRSAKPLSVTRREVGHPVATEEIIRARHARALSRLETTSRFDDDRLAYRIIVITRDRVIVMQHRSKRILAIDEQDP